MDLEPILRPTGVLALRPIGPAALPLAELEPEPGSRLEKAFSRGSGHGLLSLGADEVGTALPPALAYWRRFGAQFVTAICALPAAVDGTRSMPPIPATEDLDTIVASAPPMTGAEYLTTEILADLWRALDTAFATELRESRLTTEDFLRSRHKAWNLVGRVHFNLAENRRDTEAPFAFLATYTTRLSADAKPQHLPLGKALQEYAGAGNRDRLLSLLMPVQRAAGECAWLKAMVNSGEIYHPLRWSPRQAIELLREASAFESAGVVVRMPATWRMNRPASPRVKATIGGKTPSLLGMDALLDFRMAVTLDGETLSAAEVAALLAQSAGLVLIRGKWVEVDAERLKKTLDAFQAIERRASAEGLSFGEAMRLVSGAGAGAGQDAEGSGKVWGETVAGPWLAEMLAGLRHPDHLASADADTGLNGTLRPYQKAGVEWLRLLAGLRLGGCLADDMGLGKTIQVLGMLLALKREAGGQSKPSLLVAPASLLANWSAEIARFAPSLRVITAHPSAESDAASEPGSKPDLANVDLCITSYGFVARLPWLAATAWRLVVLDEAQAIKNPAAKQTRSVKQLRAEGRFALTGTPIENRLGDLWSIFDFVNPGLLGSAKEFSSFVKNAAEQPDNPYGALRKLVSPYILRRMKTDRHIIDDLPDKAEVKAFCSLSRRQAALYQDTVSELTEKLGSLEGIERRGIVLATLLRLKQICNHPSQWLGDGGWAEEDSGKFASLRDIVEVLASRQEKALVFTQFRETTGPLAHFLASLFGRPGLVLHGETEVRKRKDLVKQFQEDGDVPFFVLSVKAGGAGLNLTAASHVIHFDRWWNPAVENQATDRAFRIGQRKNVLVHKFVCRGTVEDKIDSMIETKQKLAGEFLSGGAELLLTEMRDEELLNVVALDLAAAMKEG